MSREEQKGVREWFYTMIARRTIVRLKNWFNKISFRGERRMHSLGSRVLGD